MNNKNNKTITEMNAAILFDATPLKTLNEIALTLNVKPGKTKAIVIANILQSISSNSSQIFVDITIKSPSVNQYYTPIYKNRLQVS